MILIIDNYDSFTYNLDQMIQNLGEETRVVRNDEITKELIKELNPKGIVLSPGPGTPQTAGNCIPVFEEYFNKIPILGVCLGHQIIGEYFGLSLKRCERPVHGKSSSIFHKGCELYDGIESGFKATRYHSLELEPFAEHDELAVSSETEEGRVMGIRHKNLPIFGVQFHPESYETKKGTRLVQNFIEKTRAA